MSALITPGAAAPVEGSTVEPRSTATSSAGRVLGWVFVLALLLGIALVSMRFVTTAPALTGVLNPQSAGPNGAKAIAELVRQQDVRVDVSRSRTSASDALTPESTLVLTDPFSLSDDAALDLIGSADQVVLLSTSSRMLNLLDLGTPAFGGGTATAQCDAPEFARVGMIDATRTFDPAPSVDGCFLDADGTAAVLRGEYQGTRVTAVDTSGLLSNANLTQNGNAALGLALLAQTEHVLWYVPSFQDGDIQADSPASLGDLTPEWVSPVIVLLLLAGLAAIWWRGRRFGPLVAETLPVTVRASETMQGRARLTAMAADAPHAASAIRSGTHARLAARLALSPRATAQEVADAASDRLRIPRGALYDLLSGHAPDNDRDLVDLARRLAELETAVDASVHTERNHP